MSQILPSVTFVNNKHVNIYLREQCIVFYISFDRHAPDARNDNFILQTTDESWKREVLLSECPANLFGLVPVQFTDIEDIPKGAQFNLLHDKNEEESESQLIYFDIAYDELYETEHICGDRG
ncbi:MAG: hypothetical protein GY781_22170 [Gammaproteobacteria bacterium]|nr:hypothetical protein [Gammaproteobacteria bacterium]